MPGWQAFRPNHLNFRSRSPVLDSMSRVLGVTCSSTANCACPLCSDRESCVSPSFPARSWTLCRASWASPAHRQRIVRVHVVPTGNSACPRLCPCVGSVINDARMTGFSAESPQLSQSLPGLGLYVARPGRHLLIDRELCVSPLLLPFFTL
jgi:hypothetical protein